MNEPLTLDERAIEALAGLERQPELRRALWAEVNAFYQRHPGLERTEVGAAFVASIFLSAWAAQADCPAPSINPSAQNQKTA